MVERQRPSPTRTEQGPVTLTYRNWRGETAERAIIPRRVWFGATDWHPEPQWFLTAWDVEKSAERDFALKDFGHSSPACNMHDLVQLQSRVSALETARRAYASEFPLDSQSDPDVGSIHENIRNLINENDRLRDAIKVFAEAMQYVHSDLPDDYSPSWAAFFTLGDFRKAGEVFAQHDAALARDWDEAANELEKSEEAGQRITDELRSVTSVYDVLKEERDTLSADIKLLKKAIFGSDKYDATLTTNAFVEMVRVSEDARLGALSRAIAAETQLQALQTTLAAQGILSSTQKETKTCRECGCEDCDPNGVGHYRG